ncbi:MAG: efflux RND transporter periplasmic adaptor subunit [Candidatus Thiodiazotropha lotti]|uniref:Efflux RND transporter periplasmic adaptor subunit n=1 Tax=Candidatus Thiodiazotropha lotti TaxID=2792787 RepID=A0A9E4N035_9GAMM|nr:efflux RND transporter periplasmic adaptor subunit [Candidatus Thiodiazotropha lotti]MCG7920536.1 efflux RND transporter periplasmic adaptor subunit [Candidatus Thiodiazotropha lotti]MCG7930580.1 efflux RND transporter periplasmic adaptor subunit [Candidatus Thiodiazotropha lotti]MCG7940142.1 efflux RND transporter periplasmic adaptor subunit [Candidatus Thiodiazotropha lotti]MCG7988343.1 efflux RND transporter periplasmic adaptor subunit [Candidatus Thiodiazotropha lotti]
MSASSQRMTQQWLKQLCRLVSGIQSAIVIEKSTEDDGRIHVERWPEEVPPQKHLLKATLKALESGRQMIVPTGDQTAKGFDHIAIPVNSNEPHRLAVGLSISSRSAQKQKAVLQALQWSLHWLKLLLKQSDGSHAASTHWIERLTEGQVTSDKVVELFAERFECDRVTLALGNPQQIEISAIYPRVEIKQQTGLLRAIRDAMFEAMDQQAQLHYPTVETESDQLLRCHNTLAKMVGQMTLCTIPLKAVGTPVGAILLERHRDQPFTPSEQLESLQAAGLTGLLLHQQQQIERPLLNLFGERFGNRMRRLLGPKGLWLKLGLIGLVSLLTLSSFIKGDYRIDARANLEGSIQRVITSPFDGYLQNVAVKAGDIVNQGTLLCQLEDRDLKLEQAKWRTELAKLEREQREALATHERSKVTLLQAQGEQLRAELELVELKLERSQIKAPLSGIIVSGDLSQSLGIPLKRGEELFKIAPLDSYRVMLQVDERAIADVQVGQTGHLRLAGYPHLDHSLKVKRILPLTTAFEGSYRFSIEAELLERDEYLRPGLQGVAKIDAGKRSLLWLATHRIVDWLQLQLWRWWG